MLLTYQKLVVQSCVQNLYDEIMRPMEVRIPNMRRSVHHGIAPLIRLVRIMSFSTIACVAILLL